MGDDGRYIEYDPEHTLREARAAYFAAAGFGPDGGYSKRFVPVKLGIVPLFIPNPPSRRRAVRYHDIHHVLTGYPTDALGEGEIAAWEVAGGCANESFAWMINVQGLLLGMLISPRATLRAFARGRRCGTLYGRPFDDALLERRVGEVRRELAITSDHPTPEAGDRLRLAGWITLSLAAHLALLTVGVGALYWLVAG